MTFMQLTNLKELWLHDNELQTLPSLIGNLKELRTLTLNFNQLTSLPGQSSTVSMFITLSFILDLTLAR